MHAPEVTLLAPVIAGNWKMHKDPEEARAFLRDVLREGLPDRGSYLLFPPAIDIPAAVEGARGSGIRVGIQNIHWERQGAFTGEISAEMAAAAGARVALIGHSERRQHFAETDEHVARKIDAARRSGLLPLVCVGETLEERQAGRLRAVLLRQLDAALARLKGMNVGAFAIAYEPVWAIGTGVNATPADATEAQALLRGRIAERLGAEIAAGTPILYGGSVKPENAAHLLDAPEVDGLLVGGASLQSESFVRITRTAAGG